jgi:PAS domain S-box-containing protein
MTVDNLPHVTRSGLLGIDRIPLGIHACHFYGDREQLIAALVPYLAAGLRENERCIWITAQPLPAPAAIEALRPAWHAVEETIQSGGLRILDFDEWYGTARGLKGIEAGAYWLAEEERALAEGHTGLRIAGNTSHVRPDDWPAFLTHEQTFTKCFKGRRIVALCSYALDHCDPVQMNKVMEAHHCAFEPPARDWQIVPVASNNVTHDDSIRPAVGSAEPDLRLLLDSAAEGLCAIDPAGAITFCNASFLRMTGFRIREEVIGQDYHRLVHHARTAGSPGRTQQRAILLAAQTGTPLHATEETFHRTDGSAIPVEYWVRPIMREGRVEGAVCTFVDISERKQAEAQQQILNRELAHRMKNTLAVVQAIVGQTLRKTADPKEAMEAINGRLAALGQAHEALHRMQIDSARIIDVVKNGVAVFGTESARIRLDGPPVDVGPKTALALTMALHELCTNAIKYGALSNDSGSVALAWTIHGDSAEPQLHLHWTERGGPPVSAPARTGFGSRIINDYCRAQLGGDATLLFEPEGVAWTLDVPLSAAQD